MGADKHSKWIVAITAGTFLSIWCIRGDAADWPMFTIGGNREAVREGTVLVDDLNAMRKAWEFDHHMGVGKGLYPGTLRKAREMGIEPFYGGAASPIVADGTLYLTYFKPDGRVRAEPAPWRTMSEPESLLPPWFFSVTADDILIAVDASTGRIKWQAVEAGKGLNRLGHKRGHWCVSPAYANGRVFSMGTAGRLYAYDAKTGEKLWEELVRPSLDALRGEYIEKRKLCWEGKEGSSLVVADGVVVVPSRSLTGVDARTGSVRWRIDDAIQARNGTPTIWQCDGRAYLLANSEEGDLRLIDPRDGTVLWHIEGLGPDLGTLSSSGDILILNRGSRHGDGKRNYGLYGALRLSLDGPKKLWTLPDTERYQHWWKLDSGARRALAVRDGRAYLVIRRANKEIDPRALLVVVDPASGKILSEQDCHDAKGPMLMEDRLLLYHDQAHSDPVTVAWWTAEATPRRLSAQAALPHVAITAYEVPMEWPYVDGFFYCRALKGLVCYDLRKPAAAVEARQLHLRIPGPMAGRRSDLEVVLYERNGHLIHGGHRGAGELHAVDVSDLQWDGKRLSGTMNVDVESNRRHEAYDVRATLGEDGTLCGTIRTGVAAFKRPVGVSGEVQVVEHEANWMPDCTHVLRLDEAVCNADRSRQYLLLFLTVRDGTLARVEGFAPRTTKGRPVVDWEDLAIRDGRLCGEVVVRYRPDPWSVPLVEQGTSAAAVYHMDCPLASAGPAGRYHGRYGVKWSQAAALIGSLR